MEKWHFAMYEVMGGGTAVPSATVALRKGDEEIGEASIGNGPMDAIFNCIDRIVGQSGKFLDCKINILHGKIFSALLSAEIDNKTFPGTGTSPDMMEAISRAYMDAHNRHLARVKRAKTEQCFLMQSESI